MDFTTDELLKLAKLAGYPYSKTSILMDKDKPICWSYENNVYVSVKGKVESESWRPHEDERQAFEMINSIFRKDYHYIEIYMDSNNFIDLKLCTEMGEEEYEARSDSIEDMATAFATTICRAALAYLEVKDE